MDEGKWLRKWDDCKSGFAHDLASHCIKKLINWLIFFQMKIRNRAEITSIPVEIGKQHINGYDN